MIFVIVQVQYRFPSNLAQRSLFLLASSCNSSRRTVMASAPARISTPRCDGCPRLPQPLSSKLAVAARRLEPATFGQGKLFFVNILPVSPTNSIFCGIVQAAICRKSLYRNILCTPVEKIVVALGIINSLRSKILRVNYLESIFCEPNHESKPNNSFQYNILREQLGKISRHLRAISFANLRALCG